MELGEALKIIKRNKVSFTLTILLAVAGVAFSAFSIVAGAIIIILDAIYAFASMGKVEEDVKLTKSDIKEAKEELNKIKDETKYNLKEVEKMKKEIFDVFGHDSFTPIERRLKNLEESVGINHGRHSYHSLKDDIDKLASDFKEFKRKMGI